MELSGFKIKKKGWTWNEDIDNSKGYFWWIVDKKRLSMYEERQGPPSKMEKESKQFLKMHNDAYIKKGIYYAKVIRKNKSIEELINNLQKQGFTDNINLIRKEKI